jgi:hypothetical protein
MRASHQHLEQLEMPEFVSRGQKRFFFFQKINIKCVPLQKTSINVLSWILSVCACVEK